MSERVIINKTSYNKSQFGQVVDNQFTQLIPTPTASVAETIDVNQFFQAYENLFFQIPKLGETNSHQYLVNKSGNYIGENTISEEVQALLEEITQLRQENLELQRQVIIVQTESINPTEQSNANLNQKGSTTKKPQTIDPNSTATLGSAPTLATNTQTSGGTTSGGTTSGGGRRLINSDKQIITVTQ